LFTSINDKVWEIVNEEHVQNLASLGNTYGVILGWFQDYYPGASLAHNKNYIKGMVVEEHTPEKFHIVTFFSLHLPKALTQKRHATDSEETFHESAAHHLPEVNNASVKNERHVAAARARWARSQVEAEDYLMKYT
jgi:hypothetical protein